jgi:hypothetical protein
LYRYAAARANETAEGAARRREDLQAELAQSLFTSLRARAGRERAQREHHESTPSGAGGGGGGSLGDRMEHLFAPNEGSRGGGGRGGGGGGGGGDRARGGRANVAAVQEEGAFALVDDDEGMRGVRLGRMGRRGGNGNGNNGGGNGGGGDEEWVGWQTGWEDVMEPVEAFPALGGGGSGSLSGWGGRGGGGGSGGAPPGVGGGSSAEAAFPALPGSGAGFLWTTIAGTASSAVPAPPAHRPVIWRQAVPQPPSASSSGGGFMVGLYKLNPVYPYK